MSIDEFDIITPFWNNPFQVITKGVWPGGDLLKDATNHRLLQRFRFDRLIEFDHARFAENEGEKKR
jgi:hypothetical protein